ncbi:hypothetical protein [Flavobacterium sp. HSC-61S13]|uniref:hypothetical protein n=1 Tax=Flavobacterium sp. HSC-61S13 TaxID=2910963 RepID=UPI00209DDE2F|nr:hypothetical protein [Flavobacterium sp. HSC-61S13]MCP1995727.1 hypothetical protein [Flavobacterium sp. HSC-61S13]
MNYKIIGALTVVVALSSCKQEVKDTAALSTSPAATELSEGKTTESHKLLYQHIKNNNELVLDVVREGDSVHGTFIYHISEKDKNTGTIKGVFEGDLLIAEYLFMSEGVTSTRQVVFKVEDNALLEGYGDIEEKEGKVVFKDVNQLKYNPQFKLELVPQSGR